MKTDGLAGGKGVLVTESRDEAAEDVRSKLSGDAFGGAGRRVVIEEGLSGPELSILAVCDGQRAVPLAPAQDFKRLGDGDTGPNTGGMGAYSPVPLAGPDVVDEVMTRAVEPTLAALRGKGIDYRGVLYAGLMLTPDGPKVLEYNVRFGDPEAGWSCPDSPATWPSSWPEPPPVSCGRNSSLPKPPSPWWPPPRTTPPRRQPGTPSRAWRRLGPSTGSPCSAGWTTTMGAWSPRVGEC